MPVREGVLRHIEEYQVKFVAVKNRVYICRPIIICEQLTKIIKQGSCLEKEIMQGVVSGGHMSLVLMVTGLEGHWSEMPATAKTAV